MRDDINNRSVEGKNCILIDDIIDSGETIVKAARFLKEHSALSVSAFITHAVLSAGSKNSIIDLLENEANKEEFVGNMERSTAAYILVREDVSTGLTYKLPLEASYARGLIDNIFITDTIETSDLSTKFHIISVLSYHRKRVNKYTMSLCTVEINLSTIKNNYLLLQDICKTSLVGAAVKANGYGLGAVQISKALIEENCRHFFVASSEEGVNLRNALGLDVNILVLNGVFEHDALELIEYNLTPVLNNLKQIEIWQKFSNLKNRVLPCYLHFNTGINRLGLSSDEIEQLINDRDLLKGLDLQYIISHLAISEEIDNPYNLEQLNRFKAYLQYFPNIKASLANSGGIFLGQDYHFDLARPGAALYGLNPLTKNPITLKAPIIHLQNLTLDSHIGYNMTFTTKRDSVIATLPLGYADGFSRNFSNQGEVFINSRSVPIVGRVSMDLINIDVTDLPPSEIFLGQEAEIIGNYCTPDKIASIIGTIGYEVLTNLGSRYKRKYIG